MKNSSCSEKVAVIPKTGTTADEKIPVAVYCRVSTRSDSQGESLENQIQHYRENVGNDPRYELIEIYHDFGISGYKESRPGFQKMMKDARAGRFRLLITKSITRFARNTDTVLRSTRELKGLGIGVYFELQGINTLSQAGELLMTLYASFGQAESEENRAGTKMAIQRKLEKGEANSVLSRVYGYSKGPDGAVQPDGNAQHVMEIFEMAADGYTTAEITNWLNGSGLRTQTGAKFYRTTVARIITNPEYKGDFISHRHFTDEHRHEVKNTGEHDQYCFEDNHTPIVTRELWQKAQQAVGNGRRKQEVGTEEKLPLTDENYPYRHQLFCGCCGYRLMRAYRNGRNLWECSGKERFGSGFCSGVSIPDSEVKSWNEFEEDRYITEKTDRGKAMGWEWTDGEEWSNTHQKKAGNVAAKAPALTAENYPYKDRIFCKYCGSRLRRIVNGNGSVTWICANFSRNGKKACRGIRVPDEKLRKLRKLDGNFYIGKENVNGKQSYGYSRKADQRKA